MRINVKIVLLSIIAALLLAYLVGVAVWSNRRVRTTTCTAIEWTITDSTRRQYVTENELANLLREQDLYPVGKKANKISTQRIENAIIMHPMVRRAQCYMTSSGVICIRLSQRIPILRVVTADESYFVDSDRLRMPIRESVTTPLLSVVGLVNTEMATGELADMVLWINHHRYWREKIENIHVVNPRYVYLVQRPDETKLILGEVHGYAHKLRKLQTLYEEGFEKIGWRTYSEIDLRYHNQVVGRNKE